MPNAFYSAAGKSCSPVCSEGLKFVILIVEYTAGRQLKKKNFTNQGEE